MTLKFKETFPQRHRLTITDIPTVMKCKNIDFGHINWNIDIAGFYSNVIVDTAGLLTHLTNNIIDVHADSDNPYLSFIGGICAYRNETALKYVINNRCIDNKFFDKMAIMRVEDSDCKKIEKTSRLFN